MGGIVTGDLLANGEKLNKEFKKSMAYVLQEDLLLSFLTVKETLGFAAKLRLSKDMSDEKKLEIAQQIIKVIPFSLSFQF